MQVTIISAYELSNFETSINNFLDDIGYKIIDIKFSQSTDSDGDINRTALIMYEDVEK